jgi:hypothetical protein
VITALGLAWAIGGGLLGLLILALWVTGLVDVIRRPDLDSAARARWIALIVLLPVVGTLIYLGKRPTLPEEREKIAAAQMSRGR